MLALCMQSCVYNGLALSEQSRKEEARSADEEKLSKAESARV